MSERVPKIAIVYDFLTTQYGGAEVVLTSLHELYPNAPIFTTVFDDRIPAFKEWDIRATFLQKLPRFLRVRHQLQALISPIAIETLDLGAYDIVISISSSVAKGVITTPRQLHVCYLLTPTRYLYHAEPAAAHWLLRMPGVQQLSSVALRYLRWWDRAAAARPDALIVLSELVEKRVLQVYGRSTRQVIYPPFKKRHLQENLPSRHGAAPNLQQASNEQFFLIVSRLVWYKKLQEAVKAALSINSKLVIAGDGPYKRELLKLAGSRACIRSADASLANFLKGAEQGILFCGTTTEQETAELLQMATALVVPGQEDFGMTVLEALAAGTPVITDATSGSSELLTHGADGILLKDVSTQSLASAFKQLQRMTFSSPLLKQTAVRYSDDVFQISFRAAVDTMWLHTMKGRNEQSA